MSKLKKQQDCLITNANVIADTCLSTSTGVFTDKFYEDYDKYDKWKKVNDVIEIVMKDESIPIDERMMVKNILNRYKEKNLS